VGWNWKAYITRDQLWAKPIDLHLSQACLMFARRLLHRVNGV